MRLSQENKTWNVLDEDINKTFDMSDSKAYKCWLEDLDILLYYNIDQKKRRKINVSTIFICKLSSDQLYRTFLYCYIYKK